VRVPCPRILSFRQTKRLTLPRQGIAMEFELLPPSSAEGPAPLGPLSAALAAPEPPPATGHRASCHRCGNMRKGILKCRRCPSTWCARCAERLAVEHGAEAFAGGCPLCLGLCCCSDERGARVCGRLYHCYKKVGGRPGAAARLFTRHRLLPFRALPHSLRSLRAARAPPSLSPSLPPSHPSSVPHVQELRIHGSGGQLAALGQAAGAYARGGRRGHPAACHHEGQGARPPLRWQRRRRRRRWRRRRR